MSEGGRWVTYNRYDAVGAFGRMSHWQLDSNYQCVFLIFGGDNREGGRAKGKRKRREVMCQTYVLQID